MVVLDLTQILAGPMCTMVLGDLGADVIKVEKPNGGDDNRRMGPPFVKDWSAGFLAANRNKRSLVVDLQREAGQTVFKRLAGDADAVIENFRPGVMERLGLGYQELAGINLRLVYCSISGFGNTGPYAKRGGFDLVAQGVSGLMSITGHPGMPPAKVGVPITDLTAGLFAANGVQAAYIRALKTGRGQHVDTSLMEAGIAYTVWESSVYFAEGEIPGPLGSAHRVSAPYQALRTKDGHLNIGAATQPTWEQLCRAIGTRGADRGPAVQDSRRPEGARGRAGRAVGGDLLPGDHRILAGKAGRGRGGGGPHLQHGAGLSGPAGAGPANAGRHRRPGHRHHPQHRGAGETLRNTGQNTPPGTGLGRTHVRNIAGARVLREELAALLDSGVVMENLGSGARR